MGQKAVVVVSLDDQLAGGMYLLRGIVDALEADTLPNLQLLPTTPIGAVNKTQTEGIQGLMFLGTTIAKRPVEVGRLTDIDLWNPLEYKHDLLSSWHRKMTKAKKEGQIPTLARALFLHHEEAIQADQLAATILPMVRRVALWTRFWNKQQVKTKASA
ncbi:hypothetical protein Pan97_52950 [Bremerella volcania]|uniref:Uncharacterized protein n=1 Tax=Bremerella volcania TaxID=2527984 RepID=A0A518CG63_9BACT|nr:hypothetical protein [Bremerella volcania]QDU78211.1 hypothetical protein Pan97_52950 [Bremerella volcania]